MGWYGSPPLSQIRTPAQYARASAPPASPRAMSPDRIIAKTRLSSTTAAIRRGSRSRDASRRRARRKTPARRRVPRSTTSDRSTMIRPRPRAVPGTGWRPAGSPWSVMARAFSHAGTSPPVGPGRCRRLSSSRLSSREHARSLAWSVADGTVIIIGGAEDKVRDRVILNRFVALAGGPDATIAVISTASSLGLEAGERYRAVFGELGVKHVRPLHAVTRPQANDETAVACGARRDGRLPDRRQPAPAVVDHRRDAPRGHHPRPLPARRGGGRARRPGRRRCRAT